MSFPIKEAIEGNELRVPFLADGKNKMLGTESAVNCQLRSLLAASIVAKVMLGLRIGERRWETVWNVWAVAVQKPQEPERKIKH